MKPFLWTLTQAILGAALYGLPFVIYFWSMTP
jgi:hypothetical protein